MARPRKKPSLERLDGESDEAFYLRTLPAPPLTMSAHDDVVAWWVEDVMRAGGLAAVEWVFDTGNWPLGSVARGRMLYFLGVLRQRDQADSKRRVEAAADEQRDRDEQERREAKRRAGWAA